MSISCRKNVFLLKFSNKNTFFPHKMDKLTVVLMSIKWLNKKRWPLVHRDKKCKQKHEDRANWCWRSIYRLHSNKKVDPAIFISLQHTIWLVFNDCLHSQNKNLYMKLPFFGQNCEKWSNFFQNPCKTICHWICNFVRKSSHLWCKGK